MIKLMAPALTFTSMALLTQGAHAEPPDILGTWEAETHTILESEGEIVDARRGKVLVFEKQDGSLVQGFKAFKALDDEVSYVGNEAVLEAREPFIGTFEPDDVTIRLVELADAGPMVGELLSPDELQMSYIEGAPHPAVWSAVFQKVAD